MTKFETDTPANIRSMNIDDVVGFVNDNFNVPPRVRLNYVKMIYDILGYELTPDIALAAISEPKSLLVLSTAGGGKTTWSQIKAIMQKMYTPSRRNPNKKIGGDKILCLVYNKHNVQDMKNKHKRMVAKLEAAGIKGLEIDDEINACTLHSFCDSWRKEYMVQMGLVGYSLIDEDEIEKYMHRAATITFKKLGVENTKVDEGKLSQFYVLVKECLKEPADFVGTDKFDELNLSVEVVTEIFNRYDSNKKLHSKYDFIDMLAKFYDLICNNEKILTDIQRYFEYVIADEVQDFTPLMWGILNKLVSNGTPLTAIGDEDQSIYAFRGADIYATLGFKQSFNDARVLTLSTNRRCRSNILELSKKIIGANTLRFNKDILGSKDGGVVKFIPYNTREGQILSVVNSIKAMSEDDRSDTVICYRNTSSSMLLSDILQQEGLTFNCLSGYRPFGHELYRHVIDILNILEQPYDRILMLNLYKVLPITKQQMCEILHYDENKHSFTEPDPFKHFAQYDYGKYASYNNFNQIIILLASLSAKLETDPMSKIFPVIFNLLNVYFWKYKKHVNDNPDDAIFEERVKRFFNVNVTYAVLFQNYIKDLNVYKSNNALHAGVTISTFHSLKGLEFKNVYVIDMDDNIFPNFQITDSKSFSDEYKKELHEAETRLWYVAVTRAKDNLYVYYYESNPSYYVRPYIADSNKSFDLSAATVTNLSDIADDFEDWSEDSNESSVFTNLSPDSFESESSEETSDVAEEEEPLDSEDAVVNESNSNVTEIKTEEYKEVDARKIANDYVAALWKIWK